MSEGVKLIQKLKPQIAQDGRTYIKMPDLKENEYYAAVNKKNNKLIHPTNEKYYLSKNKGFYMMFDLENTDIIIVVESEE